MTRSEYLTARCPYGCEAWLHPKAVEPHTRSCRRHPWSDERRPVSEVLLTGDDADTARQHLPRHLLRKPEVGDDRILKPRPGMYLRPDVLQGIVVTSPVLNVTGRRWTAVALQAVRTGHAISDSTDPDTFAKWEHNLGMTGIHSTCDICGDDVKARSLGQHRARNSLCRLLADTAEVRALWSSGFRDPFTLAMFDPAVPVTWTALNGRAIWKRRLRTVKFRLWTAVLIAPEGQPPRLRDTTGFEVQR